MLTPEQEELIQVLRKSGSGNTVSEVLLDKYIVRKTIDRMVPTRDGVTHIYMHYPDTDRHLLPVFINIHGGGFIKGHREQDIVFSKNICSRAGCIVIDIDYTPAPEQKYPYALQQCYDVVKWVAKNCGSLQVDPEKIALCGHSAGGNLVAAVSLMNNIRHDFNIVLQILDYPVLDLYTPPQLKQNAYKNLQNVPLHIARLYNSTWVDEENEIDPTSISRLANLYTSAYIDEERKLEPTASPCFAPDDMLTGLPDALIITCAGDYLCDEAEKYAYRLLQAGVSITARRMLNSVHAFVVRRNGQFEEAENMILNALDRKFRD